jgi:hypothetical protein
MAERRLHLRTACVQAPGVTAVRSDDGNVIAFASRAAFVSDDTNTCLDSTSGGAGPSCADIYVHNRTTGQTIRASVTGTDGDPNGPSSEPVLNVDGHIVAFTSDATNLVTGDTNAASDVFVRDLSRLTTGRISVTSAGAEAAGASLAPSISGDGGTVAFLSHAQALSDVPDPVSCGSPCTRAFVHVLGTGATTRVPMPPPLQPLLFGESVIDVTISSDGRWVLQSTFRRSGGHTTYSGIQLHDRLTTRSEELWRAGDPATGATLSGDGRHVVVGRDTHFTRASGYQSFAFDRLIRPISGNVGNADRIPPSSLPYPVVYVHGTTFNHNGRFVLFQSGDVFVYDRDPDQDGMVSEWERRFGLDPQDASDAALDNDGDGRTNLQEYQANTHPNGHFKHHFAEGAQNAFFNTTLALMNPQSSDVIASLQYLGSDGTNETKWVTLASLRRTSESPSSVTDAQNFSVVVESSQPIVVDRHMSWGSGTSAGAHGGTAIEAPSTIWYLAEGATHGAFDLFYLLQNPTATDAQVTIEYLRPAPAPPIVKSYIVTARSRRTIWVDVEDAALEASDLSARITSDRPIVVERSMYFSGAGGAFMAGHNGAGLAAAATRWFLAEGATGAFFDLYVLVANPGNADAALTVSYLLPEGAPVVKTYTVAPRSRATIWVEGEDPRLANTSVSTIVESTNGQPVVVERAMWWPYHDWYGTHLSAGTTTTATRWAFADGTLDMDSPMTGSETFVLIANTSNQVGAAKVRLIFVDGDPVEQSVPLPANSRVTVRIAGLFPEANGRPFGVIVDSGDVQSVVERAHYHTDEGVVWTAGYAALATKLP